MKMYYHLLYFLKVVFDFTANSKRLSMYSKCQPEELECADFPGLKPSINTADQIRNLSVSN